MYGWEPQECVEVKQLPQRQVSLGEADGRKGVEELIAHTHLGLRDPRVLKQQRKGTGDKMYLSRGTLLACCSIQSLPIISQQDVRSGLHQWMNVWRKHHIHMEWNSSLIYKNTRKSCHTPSRNLEDTVTSEVSQAQRDQNFMFSLTHAT